MTKDELPGELNDLEKFLVREDEPTLEEIETLGDRTRKALFLPWWLEIGYPAWHLSAVFLASLAVTYAARLVPFPPLAVDAVLVVAPHAGNPHFPPSLDVPRQISKL